MSYLMLAGGLALLVFSGDLLVRGSVALAERLAIPPIIIGLTIVAFGTSAPELLISVQAALAGLPGIAVGNVVGSNIANILLVLGAPALITATDCNQPFVVRNALFMLGASIIFTALCFMGPLGAAHGIVLITLLGVFLTESARRALASNRKTGFAEDCETIDGIEGVPHRPVLMIVFVVLGLLGLPLAAHLTVEGASHIASAWGVSDATIGVSIVAIGTSLPELAATVIAAMRKQGGLAIGNVLGSNLFNLLAIMGITSLVTEVEIPKSILHLDLWVMVATALMLMPFVLRRGVIRFGTGLAFVACYVGYMVFTFDGANIGQAIAR